MEWNEQQNIKYYFKNLDKRIIFKYITQYEPTKNEYHQFVYVTMSRKNVCVCVFVGYFAVEKNQYLVKLFFFSTTITIFYKNATRWLMNQMANIEWWSEAKLWAKFYKYEYRIHKPQERDFLDFYEEILLG